MSDEEALARIEKLLSIHFEQDAKLFQEFSEKLTLTALTQKHVIEEQNKINTRLQLHFEEDKDSFAELNKRLGRVEQRMNYAAGAIALAATAITIFWQAILTAVTK